jgi:hypothetical protein
MKRSEKMTEYEIIQRAKIGNRQCLDLLLKNHEQFLMNHIYKTSRNMEELLTLRKNCIHYAHTHFCDKFNMREHANFAMWLLENVIQPVCKDWRKAHPIAIKLKK